MADNGIIVQNPDILKGNVSEYEILKNKMENLINETNQFTYIITHDLQAPLRMISGFLELIEKRYADKLDDTGKQYIDFAMKGSQKMKSLIFDLLEYSRLSSVEQEFTQTDLNLVLISALDELKPVLDNSGVRVNAGHLPVVKADKRLMTILFRQILDNAVKFRSEEPLVITIGTEIHNGFLELYFTDNGIGMDPSFLEKIFVIFRRLNTDDVKYPGTGTGLAVCKKIVELHGGTIRAISEPGNGTTMLIQLANE